MIPGVIEEPVLPLAVQKTKTKWFKGKPHRYTLEKGEALKLDRLGSPPKKLLRKLEKEWRKLHPVTNEIEPWRYPRLRSKYQAHIFMKLLEACGVIKDGKVVE